MRKVGTTIGRWMLVLAMITAVGGHWAVLQSVAWATMIFHNAKCSPLGDALERTFDGQHPCALCRKIEKGRESEKKPDIQVVISKMTFLHQPNVFVLSCPWRSQRQELSDAFAEGRLLRPLLQPPRPLVAA